MDGGEKSAGPSRTFIYDQPAMMIKRSGGQHAARQHLTLCARRRRHGNVDYQIIGCDRSSLLSYDPSCFALDLVLKLGLEEWLTLCLADIVPPREYRFDEEQTNTFQNETTALFRLLGACG